MAYLRILLVILLLVAGHVVWDAVYEVARPKGVEVLGQSSTRALAQEIEAKAYRNFTQADFTALEAQFTEARTPLTLYLPDGMPKLMHVYYGIDRALKGDMPWEQQEALIEQWRTAYPSSAAAQIAQARLAYQHAWKLRGRGYMRDVNSEQQRAFIDLLDQARELLNAHRDAAAIDPVWHTTMVNITGGQYGAGPQLTKVVEAAAKQHPNYIWIYSAALNYLQPRWGGSVDEIEAFANWAATTGSPQMGDEVYARLYASFTDENNAYRYNLFMATHANWLRMRNGFEALVSKWPDAINHNLFAMLACTAGDREAAARQLQAIGNQPLDEVWHRPIARFTRCKSWAGIEQSEKLNIPIPGNPNSYDYVLQSTARDFINTDYAALEARHTDYLQKSSAHLATFYEALESVTTSNMIGGPSYWQNRAADVKQWQQAFPNSYLPKLMQASLYYNEAHLLTGQEDETPAAITAKARANANALTAKAYALLQSLKETAGHDPWWQTLMLKVQAASGVKRPVKGQGR